MLAKSNNLMNDIMNMRGDIAVIDRGNKLFAVTLTLKDVFL